MNNSYIVSIAAAATALLVSAAPNAAEGRATRKTGDSPPLAARMTLPNGEHRIVSLEGVGCSVSLCSRVFVNGRANGEGLMSKTRLDTIAAIKDITKDDALFVFKDGTERRLSVTISNRVLYMMDEHRGKKIDLTCITSLEFQ